MFEKTELITINIEGMHCMHCVKRVEAALKAVPGVKKFKVNLEGKCADVHFIPEKTNKETVIKAVADAGYTVNG